MHLPQPVRLPSGLLAALRRLVPTAAAPHRPPRPAVERGQVQVGDATIGYTIVRSVRRRKTVQITLDPTKGVVVAAPRGATDDDLRSIVVQRSRWILQRAPAELLQPERRALATGETLLLLGQTLRLEVASAAIRRPAVTLEGEAVRVMVRQELDGEARRAQVERTLTGWYRSQATAFLGLRVEGWALLMDVTPKRVMVGAARRRWGSCSADGALRFTWRLIMAPPDLVDYVVVHELAHLRVPNHAAAFWNEVAAALPDFRQRRAALNKLEPTLSL